MSARTRPLEVRYDAPGVEEFREDVLAGLRQPEKRIPYKYLYDQRGSDLFEQICDLEEYYLTRTELAIMERQVGAMAAALGPRCLVIEYGSGSGLKTRLLLEHLEDPVGYVPIDISSEALVQSAARLNDSYPSLEVLPVNADYSTPIRMPRPSRRPARRVIYFPGSTIGNLLPSEARGFLVHVADVAGPGGALLIGVDLKKDPAVLEAAYDDGRGVTASFTKNLLLRINRELDGDFDADRFRHHAAYSRTEGRVEIHLISEVAQRVRVSGEWIAFEKGEGIHIEYSYKYDPEEFRDLAASAGLRVRKVWTDPRRLFSVQFLTVL